METELIDRVDSVLRDYVEANIFPRYARNDSGHQIGHIDYVVRRSLKFATMVSDINYDIVYVVAAYHDLGHYVDAFRHEQVSAKMVRTDAFLRKFFTLAEIETIAEAIEDHRSHIDRPRRSVYGKIVASADCNINVDVMLRRTYSYRVKNFPAMPLEEVIEESRQHLCRNYGEEGYVRGKMYFPDPEFDRALRELIDLVDDPVAQSILGAFGFVEGCAVLDRVFPSYAYGSHTTTVRIVVGFGV